MQKKSKFASLFMSKHNFFINYILLSTDASFILKICIVWADKSALCEWRMDIPHTSL